jgi:polyhydroxyalkanoate synthase subunit PhaC
MTESNREITRAADPFGAAAALAKLGQAWMNRFPELMERLHMLNGQVQETVLNEMQRAGSALDAHKSEAGLADGDILSLVRELSGMARRSHAVYSGWIRQLIEDAPDLEDADRRRSAFWVEQLLNALAPANYFWTNPGAVQRYLASGGKSLENGVRNWVDDVVQGDNLMRLVDESAFKLGENIAATPGSVVFRNELMELIQYHPATETGFKPPIVMIQPWINKYYIFDLSAHNSFVRYLVGRGFPVFITSWKNPDETLRHVTFEDYLFMGLLPAIEAATDICGSPVAHATGYCIGGTALAALMAWFNSDSGSSPAVPVATWSLFSTLTDFSDPGMLGVFTGEEGIETVERLASQDGYLDSRYIRTAFRLLNSDGLIWRYVANNYLFGQMPPKSDLLYWDSDGTRLSQAMCSGYLRDFYLSNRLIRPKEMVLGGRGLDLGAIAQPAWIVGAEQDHIASWKGTFQTCRYLSCPTTYVLANEGHITGIVSPPSPRSRKKFWAGVADATSDPDTWRSHRKTREGSWWTGWVKWLSKHSESGAKPPPVGNSRFPVLGPAPGTYVLEK